MRTSKMKTAIFLGAGASKAEGAPLQGEMFKEYFKFVKQPQSMFFSERHSQLDTFFQQIFNIDVNLMNLDLIDFPTFEEVLGVLDQAILRNETLKDYDLDNINDNSNRLRQIRTYVILAMAEIIDNKLLVHKGLHNKLIKRLINENVLENCIFLTTNYDILIDNALSKLIDRNIPLDYLIEFENFNRVNDWRRPSRNANKLFKLHGSLNWLFCPTCNNITLTPLEKGISRLFTNIGDAICPDCETLYTPILIPPTFFKNMGNVFIQQIWNKAEQELRKVDHVIFCGYSFPDADVHIKYLLKRIQTNREMPMRFTVINRPHKELVSLSAQDEEKRYKRFLGPTVHYTKASFEEFVADPILFFIRIKSE